MNGISRFLFVSILAVVLTACSSGRSPDNTLPVVTLTGDNPQILAFGEAYTELGATASDNRDGDATASIVIDAGGVDTATPGDYTVTYNVTDAAGNAATVTRTVTVQPPVPEQAEASVTGDIKQLVFNWNEVQFTDYYRLMENPDGHSGFTQLGEDIPADTRTATQDIAVHLFDWYESQYLIEACNVTGCSTSDVVTVTDAMLDTIGYFKASNTDMYDNFGAVIALSADGKTLAVSALGEDSCATGINGDQTDNSCPGSGAVYLFRSGDSGWHQQAYFKSSNTDSSDKFGSTIALSADGNTLAVGAPGEDSSATGINGDQADNSLASAGAVYMFRYDDGDWRQSDYIKASNTGIAPHLHRFWGWGDGIADFFGATVALSANGGALAVAGSETGLYIFQFDGDTWYEQAYFPLHPIQVAMTADGNTVAVTSDGDPHEYGGYVGSTTVFHFENDDWYWPELDITRCLPWDCESQIEPMGLAISAAGDLLVVGAWNRYWRGNPLGMLLRADGLDWNMTSSFGSSEERDVVHFGLSGDGNTLGLTAWGDDSCANGINGDEDDISCEDSGAVHLRRLDGNVWGGRIYVKASTVDAGDGFFNMALDDDGNTLVVGASGEDSCDVGINGDQYDNRCEDAGAVYVY